MPAIVQLMVKSTVSATKRTESSARATCTPPGCLLLSPKGIGQPEYLRGNGVPSGCLALGANAAGAEGAAAVGPGRQRADPRIIASADSGSRPPVGPARRPQVSPAFAAGAGWAQPGRSAGHRSSMSKGFSPFCTSTVRPEDSGFSYFAGIGTYTGRPPGLISLAMSFGGPAIFLKWSVSIATLDRPTGTPVAR